LRVRNLKLGMGGTRNTQSLVEGQHASWLTVGIAC
jgi:hypothetical protein